MSRRPRRGLEQRPRVYDAGMAILEWAGLGAWRRAALQGVEGRVLEVGSGTGRNLPLYPEDVRVVATDPDVLVLRTAGERSPSTPLVAARAEALPFREGTFGAVVSTLVFCSVDDPEAGLAELRRVLRPNGSLHMLEHVRSDSRLLASLQDLIQPAWTVLAGGCRPNRDTVGAVEAAGFRILPDTFHGGWTLRRFRAHPGRSPPGRTPGLLPRSRPMLEGTMSAPDPDPGVPGPSTSPPLRPPASKEEVREYYRTVVRFLELELAGRDDDAYWKARVREFDGPRILELGAGTGRVTRVLAPAATAVVAVDLSPQMIARAREVLEDVPHVHLLLADMRELALDRTFDLVVAANDPFVHLPTDEERDQALAVVASHLRPGGLFVLDAHWLRPRARQEAASSAGWQRERSLGDPEEELSVFEAWTLDPETWTGTVRYEYRRGGNVVGRAAFRPRLWSPDEVEARFPAAGLRLRRLLGNYREEPWEPESATGLIVEAVREPES